MPQWNDLFLALPVSENVLDALLFISFGLHLLFVLLMLGTAMLGLALFLHALLHNNTAQQPWNSHLVHSHLGLKSLAVVLGVAPLLVMQVRYSYAFFTTTGLFSYSWLAIIPLLILAFLLIDAFGHKLTGNALLAFVCGMLGVGALMTVPAVFTGALALMERPQLWPVFAAAGFGPQAPPALHWLLRYLHVLGAALVLGAAFHLFFSTKDQPRKALMLRRWLWWSLLAQLVLGLGLLLTVRTSWNGPVLTSLAVGVLATLGVLLVLRRTGRRTAPPALLALLPVVFAAMLTGRQLLQDAALAPMHDTAVAAREARAAALAPFSQKALENFALKLRTVYDNGDTIYDGACAPCHGLDGRGQGPEARHLRIPAADLAAIRADRGYAYALIRDGVPGSGMPYFRLYDRKKLEVVLDTLDKRYSMLTDTPQPPHDITPQALTVWIDVCAVCHAANGAVSDFGKTLRPAPPDLRRLSVSHQRALHVITEGYPGTVMQPFRHLPAPILDDLAVISGLFRVQLPQGKP